MRILVICGDPGIPAFGRKGASTHLRETIAGYRRMGHEVMLVAANLSGDRREDEVFPTATWAVPRARILGSDVRGWLSSRRARTVLEQAVREFRPDAIHERLSLYFTAGRALSRRHKLPRILEVNSLLADELKHRLHFPRIAAAIENKIVSEASGLAVVTEPLRDQLVGVGASRDRIRLFSMAVDPERFRPRGHGRRCRTQSGLPPDAIIVGYVGSMNHYHKPSLFFETMEQMMDEDPRLAILVVGGAEQKVQRYRDRMARFVEAKRAAIIGEVPHDDLVGWLEAMDVVLVPGAAPYSSPTKVFETASLGRPMLLPTTEPIRELCGPGAEKLLHDGETRESLAAKLREWVAAPATFDRANAALRESVLSSHTWDHHCHRLTEWFHELGVPRPAVV